MSSNEKKTKRRTQAERIEASEKSIHRAAIYIIANEGINALTVAKAGKLAGYTSGAVVHLFKNKSGLLKAVVKRILELWDYQLVTKIPENTPPSERLKLHVDIYLDNVRSKNDLIVAQFRLMQDSHSGNKEILPFFKRYDKGVRERILNIVEEGKESGEFHRNENSRAFAVVYIGMVRGIALQYFINRSGFDLDEAKEKAYQFCDDLLVSPEDD